MLFWLLLASLNWPAIEVKAREALADWVITAKVDAEILRRYRLVDERGALQFGLLEPTGKGKALPVAFQASKRGNFVLLTILLRGTTPKGGRRLFLLTKTRPLKEPRPTPTLAVERRRSLVIVKTRYFEATHDLTKGGTLTSVKFARSGRTWHLSMNDRLYRRDLGGFCLEFDRMGRLLKIESGPLAAEISFRARYFSPDGRPCPSGASAIYRYRYFATLPLVEVEAEIHQESPMMWDELHFLELRTKERFFGRFGMGPPIECGMLIGSRKTHSLRGKLWGALFNSLDAVGLIGRRLYGIHDGLGDYGIYVHGPWLRWSGREARFRTAIYLGPSGGDGSEVWKAGLRWLGGVDVSVLVPEIEHRARRILSMLEGLRGRDDVALLTKGLVGAALSTSRRGGPLHRAEAEIEAAERVAKALRTGRSPRLPVVLALPNGEVVLANSSTLLRLSVGPGGTRLLGILNLKTGHEYLLHESTSLWRLTLKDLGRKEIELTAKEAASRSFRLLKEGKVAGVEIDWRNVKADRVRVGLVRARVRADEGLIKWSLEIEGMEGSPALWLVEFPIVGGVGTKAASDFLAVPKGWGRILRNVSLGCGHRNSYPGAAFTMQFYAYWTGKSGLYFAAHDPEARTKEFRAVPDPEGGLKFSVVLLPEDMGLPKRRWRMPFEIVLRAYQGDWFEAAKIYRSWALRQKWCRKGALHTRPSAERRFAELSLNYRPSFPRHAVAIVRMHQALKVPAFAHVYSWHKIPFDNNYPEYFPPKEGFPEFVKRLHSLGLLVMPYINGRLWDTDTESWREEKGVEAAAKREDGGLYLEHWAKQNHAVMCPWTAKWREKICSIVERIARDLDCDGVYIDQVAAASAMPCFDRSHGHPLGGGGWWVEGYRRIFEEAKRRARRYKPGFFITSEDNAEPYMGALDGYLMRCAYRWMLGRDTIPLFPAVYGGYVVMFAHGWDHGGNWLIDSARMLVWGAQLGSVATDSLLGPGNRRGLEFLRRLLRARLATTRWLAFGEMRRAPEIEGKVPVVRYGPDREAEIDAIQRAAWLSPDGNSLALIFVNTSDEREVDFTWEADARECGLPEAGRYRLKFVFPEEGDGRTLRGPLLRSRLSLPPWGVAVLAVEPAPPKR